MSVGSVVESTKHLKLLSDNWYEPAAAILMGISRYEKVLCINSYFAENINNYLIEYKIVLIFNWLFHDLRHCTRKNL